MSEHFTLEASIRADQGKGASRRLRRNEDLIPAILYGAHQAPEMISLVHKDVLKTMEQESFFSSIITLNLAGKAQKAILKDVQRHPYKPRVLHMDFMRISATEKFTMHVPLHIVGEKASPGVKAGGVVSKHMGDLLVKCLPSDLPESIDVDISKLELNESIHLSQVKLPKGVELAHPVEDAEHDQPVVNIFVPRAAEEVTDEVPASAEVPTIVQKADTNE